MKNSTNGTVVRRMGTAMRAMISMLITIRIAACMIIMLQSDIHGFITTGIKKSSWLFLFENSMRCLEPQGRYPGSRAWNAHFRRLVGPFLARKLGACTRTGSASLAA